MKTITIRLPDVEVAMFGEIQKEAKVSKELLRLLTVLIEGATLHWASRRGGSSPWSTRARFSCLYWLVGSGR